MGTFRSGLTYLILQYIQTQPRNRHANRGHSDHCHYLHLLSRTKEFKTTSSIFFICFFFHLSDIWNVTNYLAASGSGWLILNYDSSAESCISESLDYVHSGNFSSPRRLMMRLSRYIICFTGFSFTLLFCSGVRLSIINFIYWRVNKSTFLLQCLPFLHLQWLIPEAEPYSCRANKD